MTMRKKNRYIGDCQQPREHSKNCENSCLSYRTGRMLKLWNVLNVGASVSLEYAKKCTDKSTLAQMLKLFIRLLNLPGIVGTGVVGGGGT